MSRFVLGLAVGAVVGAVAVQHVELPPILDHRVDVEAPQSRPRVELPDVVRDIVAPRRRVTVYLHREGGRVTAGPDDAAQMQSILLKTRGMTEATVAPYRGTQASWDALKRCVEHKFDGLAVDVVDRRPAGEHIAALIGGAPSSLRLDKTTGGLAPHDGGLRRRAVVFVFQRPHPTARALCETTAHEIGHALGLDHSRLCSDLMSYESCGPKAFRDHEAHCGERSSRACFDGRTTQNSWDKLADLIGEERPRASPKPESLATTRHRHGPGSVRAKARSRRRSIVPSRGA